MLLLLGSVFLPDSTSISLSSFPIPPLLTFQKFALNGDLHKLAAAVERSRRRSENRPYP